MMDWRFWRAARRVGLALCVLIGAGRPAQAAEAPVPLADFFDAPAMSRPVMSPSGKHLAVQVPGPDGRRRLAVLALDALKDSRLVAAFGDADIDAVHWVNDERLVFTITDLQASLFNQFSPGLFAVDRDGRNLRSLVQREWHFISNTSSAVISHELRPNHRLLRVLRDGSSDVAVLRTDWRNNGEVTGTTALRLDTLTGRSTSLSLGAPAGTRHWVLDEKGRPQMIATWVEDREHILVRDASGEGWMQIADFPIYLPAAGRFWPSDIGLDGQLYAMARSRSPEGEAVLHTLDRNTHALSAEALVSVKGFDFDGELLFDSPSRRLIGVRYSGDADDTQWLDPAMKALQARIDQRLPGTINRLDVAECGCSRWVLISSFSDRQPGVFTLYDKEADAYQRIGASRPRIDARQMARRDFQRIGARDGLSLPVHITRPNNPGPWPMVVWVHGGPYVRGARWAWTAESQFLASRGYLVVEPEFRGSTGYGQKLFRAGWKQWGLKMQDDIADAARWAVAQGLADPKRVCIAGGSYGGYAALMGLIRDPDLYRCGVAMAAVTDIGLMYDISWSDLPEVWQQYGMPALIGDKLKDAEQLAATSPLQQAASLNRPLLLVHGGMDRRVPIEHFKRLRDAIDPQAVALDTLVFADEGHGFMQPANRLALWTRIEGFLGKYLAQP